MKVRAERVPIETLREWVSYDSASGHIVWVKGKKAVSVGMRAGYVANTGHRVFKIEQKRYFAHRVAWGIHHGRWPPDGFDVDHINGNRDDNTAANLRLATRSQNIANSKISARNTSGVKGVTWSKRERKWMTQIRALKVSALAWATTIISTMLRKPTERPPSATLDSFPTSVD